MALWEAVVIIDELIKYRRNAKKERRRTNVPCSFSDGISREQFEEIVRKSGRHIKRLIDLSVRGAIVYGTVRAKSGLSEWDFQVDFNDYGHLTGEYWLLSDNDDSKIPGCVADKISSMIQEFPKGFENTYTASRVDSPEYVDEEVGDDDEYEQENLERTRQQANAFKEYKRNRVKKKMKYFFVSLLVVFVIMLLLFIVYEVWEYRKRIEVGLSSSQIVGLEYEKVVDSLEDAGFTNIHAYPEYDLELADIKQENMVLQVSIKGDTGFEDTEKFPYDARVEVTYHALKHIYVPISADDAEDMNYEELTSLLREAGFVNITTYSKYDLITGWIKKEYSVESISINGDEDFFESASFRPDAEVVILYHRFKSDKE